MAEPTMAQMAYLNSLYEQLGIPWTHREKPKCRAKCSVMIEDLRSAVEERMDQAIEESE